MKTRVACIPGSLQIDPQRPRLAATRCIACGTVYFPREQSRCRNPRCGGKEFAQVELSSRGKLWSYTNAAYKPPEPYIVRSDPYEPFALAAVELEAEKMIVLGQVVDGVDFASLRVGMEMELALGVLFEDAETETITWKWKPVAP
jgi:uncharacterized OB-fold protein